MLDSMRQYKAGVFRALAHPTRVAIVEFLNYGEMSVGHLCEKIGLEQSNASQHLAVLRNKHIVQTRKDGNQIYYSLGDPAFGQVLQTLRAFFLAHLNETLELVQREQKAADRAEATRPKVRKTARREVNR
ncbi:MAG: ArsR/SmtB family transcription factor [Gemmataceae bacterium]